jgi:hypothetical protein
LYIYDDCISLSLDVWMLLFAALASHDTERSLLSAYLFEYC